MLLQKAAAGQSGPLGVDRAAVIQVLVQLFLLALGPEWPIQLLGGPESWSLPRQSNHTGPWIHIQFNLTTLKFDVGSEKMKFAIVAKQRSLL